MHWLSLETIIKRVLEQRDPLVKYFLESIEAQDVNFQCSQIQTFFRSSETKLNCLFLQNTIDIFTSTNSILQTKKPCIHILKAELDKLYHNLLARFLKPLFVTKTNFPYPIHFTKEKHQKDDDLVIGSQTRVYLRKGGFSNEYKSQFHFSVRNLHQMVQWLGKPAAVPKLPDLNQG